MIAALSPEAREMFQHACKRPMLPTGDEGLLPLLDQPAIEAILPHRAPFLLIDRVTLLDRDHRLIVARYDLARAGEVFAGHFPGAPMWPGVLQVEAIGQAGIVLAHACLPASEDDGNPQLALTHILGAQFVRPVVPGGDVIIAARLIEDGLFAVIVGQCLRRGEVCSAAAVRGLVQGGVL
jgi:3-hydroxymyristoyl/3-hydroxydecanoyl-(acyl carrier protein) dehydratase